MHIDDERLREPRSIGNARSWPIIPLTPSSAKCTPRALESRSQKSADVFRPYLLPAPETQTRQLPRHPTAPAHAEAGGQSAANGCRSPTGDDVGVRHALSSHDLERRKDEVAGSSSRPRPTPPARPGHCELPSERPPAVDPIVLPPRLERISTAVIPSTPVTTFRHQCSP